MSTVIFLEMLITQKVHRLRPLFAFRIIMAITTTLSGILTELVLVLDSESPDSIQVIYYALIHIHIYIYIIILHVLGQADESLMSTAVEESLNETERRMLLDKAKMTDYQATDQALLAQVARLVNSYYIPIIPGYISGIPYTSSVRKRKKFL